MSSLFSHPNTKEAFIEEELGVWRATAMRYFDALCEGTLSKQKQGRVSYDVNDALVAVLFELPPIE